ncbi:MAG: ABC transporter permease [Bacilli bacterium]|nr:ABC transporter permease [Bacilli bacterium]
MNKLTKCVLKNQIIVSIVLAVSIILFYFLAIFNVEENAHSTFGQWYWLIMGLIFGAFICYGIWSVIRAKNNKHCLAVNIADKMIKYGFLLKQLVKRDFKRKYKRSVLGVLWSFLNPLLMMGTQYLVFSTLLGNQNIPYFPVYLLVGIVTFNFFSECTTTSMESITGNASLIKKVYVPKYIYTLSKALSATINFGFALIPLFIFMLAMQLWPTPGFLLFFFNIGLLFVFCLGLSMFLATIMVFFRDMHFIWGVIRLAWMYATPIFYSVERIQNETFKMVMKFNPLFHFLKVSRMLIIDRVSPNLYSYLWCLISAAGMFAIGCITFKTQQEKFSLYV